MKKEHLAKTSCFIVIFVMMALFALAGSISAASLQYSSDDLEQGVELSDAYGIPSGTSVHIYIGQNEYQNAKTTYSFYPYGGDDFSVDAFCISEEGLDSDNPGYTLKLLDGVNMEAAARIASNFFHEDFAYSRAAAQVAIWEIIFGEGNYNLFDGTFQLDVGYKGTDFAKEVDLILTSFSNWSFRGVAYAESFGTGNYSDNPNQDLLVPVPEPALVLLIAIGLIGLVGIGRKKFMKSLS